jgi:hypothetical protein
MYDLDLGIEEFILYVGNDLTLIRYFCEKFDGFVGFAYICSNV